MRAPPPPNGSPGKETPIAGSIQSRSGDPMVGAEAIASPVRSRGAPIAALLTRTRLWGPLRPQALLLLLHYHLHSLLVEMGDHPLELLLDLAELVLLLHLHLRLGCWGHLLEGSLIIFPESRCGPLAGKLGDRIRGEPSGGWC